MLLNSSSIKKKQYDLYNFLLYGLLAHVVGELDAPVLVVLVVDGHDVATG